MATSRLPNRWLRTCTRAAQCERQYRCQGEQNEHVEDGLTICHITHTTATLVSNVNRTMSAFCQSRSISPPCGRGNRASTERWSGVRHLRGDSWDSVSLALPTLIVDCGICSRRRRSRECQLAGSN